MRKRPQRRPRKPIRADKAATDNRMKKAPIKTFVELRMGGASIPFAWWISESENMLHPANKIIMPPEEFTVRAYKNYNAAVVKKYRLPVKITFKKGKRNTLICSVDGGPEEILEQPQMTITKEMT